MKTMIERIIGVTEDELIRQGDLSGGYVGSVIDLAALVLVVMEAMREPTDAMVEAALDNAHNTATVYRDAWRHMVDAALKEADPE